MGMLVKCLLVALVCHLAHSQEISSTEKPSTYEGCYGLPNKSCTEVFLIILGTTLIATAAVLIAFGCATLCVHFYHNVRNSNRTGLLRCLDLCRNRMEGDRSEAESSSHAILIDNEEGPGAQEQSEEIEPRPGSKREGQLQESATKKPRLEREPFSMPSSPTGRNINPEVTSSTPAKPGRNEGYNFEKAEGQFDPKNLDTVVVKEEPKSADNSNVSNVSVNGSVGMKSPKVEYPDSPDSIVVPDVNSTKSPIVEEVDPSTPAEISDVRVQEAEDGDGDANQGEAEPDAQGSGGSSFEKIGEDRASEQVQQNGHDTSHEAEYTANSSNMSYNSVSESTEESETSSAQESSAQESSAQESSAQESSVKSAKDSTREDAASSSSPQKSDSFLSSYVERQGKPESD